PPAFRGGVSAFRPAALRGRGAARHIAFQTRRTQMSITPAIAIHMTAAIGALVTGPVALWARKGAKQRPKLHRAFGYAWVTLMVATAVSAMFIHSSGLPNIAGFGPIHILVPVTLVGLFGAFLFLA